VLEQRDSVNATTFMSYWRILPFGAPGGRFRQSPINGLRWSTESLQPRSVTTLWRYCCGIHFGWRGILIFVEKVVTHPSGSQPRAKPPELWPNVGAIRRRAPQAVPPALSHIHRRNGICPGQLPAGSWSCSSRVDSETGSITEWSWTPLASSSQLATSTRSGS